MQTGGGEVQRRWRRGAAEEMVGKSETSMGTKGRTQHAEVSVDHVRDAVVVHYHSRRTTQPWNGADKALDFVALRLELDKAIVDSGTPAICRAVVPPRRNEWPE